MSNKKELEDEDLDLLKDLFRKSEEQKDSIEDIKEFTTPKRRAITNTKITKIQLQIDESNEIIPQTETVDKKEPIHIDRIKKKVKKKEILAQIYEYLPLIQENNILLKEIAQNLQTIDLKFKSLMQGPIKIKVIK